MARKRFEGRFIWNTSGDWCAVELDGHIWDSRGEWIGWVEGDDVYKSDGEWIGKLSKDNRIIQKRRADRRELRDEIPETPEPPDMPARAPLPPQFAELTFSQIDVLEEDPDVFKRVSERKEDMS